MNLRPMSAMTLAIFTSFALGACSSTGPKASIASTANPAEEVNKMENDLNSLYEAQYDILAPEEMEQSQKYLSRAKKDLSENEKQSEILEEVAIARGYLEKAREKAKGRGEHVADLLKTRMNALSAGARNFNDTREELNSLDKDLRKYAVRPQKMDAEDFGELQNDYIKLEAAATKKTQLGDARARIEGAVDNRATSRAPKTLTQAKQDVVNAENMIDNNLRNPSNYKSDVEKANRSTIFLSEVLAATKSGRDVLPEAAAINIVNKNRKISSLDRQLGSTQRDLEASASRQEEMSAAVDVAALDRALKAAAKDFSKSEAEVYRQGDSLLIRLKSINFASGRSDLPAASLAVLTKVKDIAEELKASRVVVEGHTDSVGSKAINQDVSQKRADAVAGYLETNGLAKESIETIGYGYSKPLTSNKSKEGRANNRRVDIIITPSAQAMNDASATNEQ